MTDFLLDGIQKILSEDEEWKKLDGARGCAYDPNAKAERLAEFCQRYAWERFGKAIELIHEFYPEIYQHELEIRNKLFPPSL